MRYVTEPVDVLQAPYRWLSARLVPTLARWHVRPNQVTVGRGLLALAILGLIAYGSAATWLSAFALFFLFEVLDHVDGDLARFTNRTSRTGRLLEQFIDTWASRPSNLFGLATAVGSLRLTGSQLPLWLWAAIALGRLMWLEYRDDFGWVRLKSGEPLNVPKQSGTIIDALVRWAMVAYTWLNVPLLLALVIAPVATMIDMRPSPALVVNIAFFVTAVISNVPWIAIVVRGFRGAE